MRERVTFEPDVAKAVEQLRRKRGIGVRRAVNDLIRTGLGASRPELGWFTQDDSSLGVPHVALDHIAEALSELESAARR